MFELYSNVNKIPKEKYDVIYKMIVDNYSEWNPDVIDDADSYNTWVNTILNTEDYYILIYYLDNVIVGFACFMYFDNYLCLSEVGFSKEYKNKGYLRSLLSKVYELSDKSRFNLVYGNVNKKNILSQNVVKHIGFVNTHRNVYEISKDSFEKWLVKK